MLRQIRLLKWYLIRNNARMRLEVELQKSCVNPNRFMQLF